MILIKGIYVRWGRRVRCVFLRYELGIILRSERGITCRSEWLTILSCGQEVSTNPEANVESFDTIYNSALQVFIVSSANGVGFLSTLRRQNVK